MDCKVILLGDSGVGKTCIMQQFVTDKFSKQHRATVGADFVSKNIKIEDTIVCLKIWDTSGQERFQSLGVGFYRGADACMLVFDITDRKSFDNLESWMEDFVHEAKPETPDDFPFVIIGNKSDLAESRRIVQEASVQEWCQKKNNLPYYETSAKDAINIDTVFRFIARRAYEQKPPIEDESRRKTVVLEDDYDPSICSKLC